jgi:tRNA pseudouridine55 synthase
LASSRSLALLPARRGISRASSRCDEKWFNEKWRNEKFPNHSITQSLNLLMNGVIIVDKPAGWTSHDVVNRMRRILGQRAVGHLGTLDPLATGVLPLVVGNFTRLAQFYTASEKTYEGVIRFGFATTTYDADGDPVEPNTRSASRDRVGAAALGCPGPDLILGTLQQLAAQFVGVVQQTPPPFSAKKIHGVPAYKLARKNKEVNPQPVQVEIREFSITSVEDDRAHFRARVSSGTYMRSVAHDLGQRLGCGAHLESLRRTSVAEFDITHAHPLEEIEALVNDSKIGRPHPTRFSLGGNVANETCHSRRNIASSDERQCEVEKPAFVQANEQAGSQDTATPTPSFFIHPRQLLPQFPCVTADEPTAARIRNGRSVNLPELSRASHVKVFANQTDLIAVATRIAGSLFHPKIVLCGAGDLARRS